MAVIIELSCRSLLDLVVPAKQIRVAKLSYGMVKRTISTSGHERVQAHPEQAELRFDANGNGESVALACAPARDIEATVFESISDESGRTINFRAGDDADSFFCSDEENGAP
ncbi:hypothetical protein [Halorientalis marina]|uniref:hypothetical protein n=1 Tax=Halorientalis marina TaxID=2931976 RepID=UPI001FF4FF96|nr:hypothetical protein [Halorientalis marina]